MYWKLPEKIIYLIFGQIWKCIFMEVLVFYLIKNNTKIFCKKKILGIMKSIMLLKVFFAIQDQNNSSELLLMLDYGIFYEFIPMDSYGTTKEKIIPLSEVETDKNYAVVITTN